MKIIGKRVNLISFSDLVSNFELKSIYLEWLNDIEVVESIGAPNLLVKKELDFIDKSFERFTSENCLGFFIFHNEANCYIGTAKIDKICNLRKSAEDGIMIGNKHYWHKGLATEIYQLLINFAFKELELNRLTSGCNSNNRGMIKVLEKMGYTREGVLRKADYIKGEFSDHYLYGILREEYLNNLQKSNGQNKNVFTNTKS
ncbi:MAG: GNAT family N-acetyltransferase [Bdellovibrionaceae bacterium]|nr:GNAT family N-acetyltransferase [Pseudobdellovibrionaceae bacterium]